MLCKACNTDIPKKAKKCPKCGWTVRKDPKNIKPIAIAGAVISFIGGLLPFIQDSTSRNYKVAYSFMNYDNKAMWYIFMLLLVASMILCAVKYEKISIITTVLSAVIFGITYNNICGQYGAPDMMVGLAMPVIIVGTVLGVAGCFLDVLKLKKKPEVDQKYMGNSRTVWQKMYIHRWFYVMALPVIIFVILFNYLPMAGLRYAFMSYKLGADPSYVGISQFLVMFSKKLFLQAFTNTLVISIVKLILNTFMAVVISILLNEMTNIVFKKSVQTIIYLPHFMSWVVVASIFTMMLSRSESGFINQLLMKIGLTDTPLSFLDNSKRWRGVYYLINIGKDTGGGTILFLATLSGISPELYEAAQIDGANRFNRMKYITLPALANTIITVFILNLAKVMNLFESVFVLQNDAVIEVSDVIQTYVYRQSFGGGIPDYGYTTAVGLFRSIISCVLVLLCNYASKKVRGRGIV